MEVPPVKSSYDSDRFERMFTFDPKTTKVVDGYHLYSVVVEYKVDLGFDMTEHSPHGFIMRDRGRALTVTVREVPEFPQRERNAPERSTDWHFDGRQLDRLDEEIGSMPRGVYELVKRALRTFPVTRTEPA